MVRDVVSVHLGFVMYQYITLYDLELEENLQILINYPFNVVDLVFILILTPNEARPNLRNEQVGSLGFLEH